MIYLTNLLARIWYNSIFEQKYTQYTILFYAFLILQAYKNLKGHEFWSFLPSKMLFHVCIIDVCPKIYLGEILFLMFNEKEDILSYNYVHQFCISIGELFF